MEDPTKRQGSARPLSPALVDEKMPPFLDASRLAEEEGIDLRTTAWRV